MITFDRWDEIKQTYNAFWNRTYDGNRPLVHLRARKADTATDIADTNIWYRGEMFAAGNTYSSLEDFYTNPQTVVKRYRHYFENIEYFGEAFPAAVINQGPGALAAYHGCTPRLLEDTIWFEHYIEDWDRDFIEFTEDNEWFQLSKKLISAFVDDSRGEYMVGMPDINAVSNALSLMRDNSSLCMDLVMQPDKIKHYTERLLETHSRTLRELFSLVAGNQEGYTDWMGLWAPDLGFPVQCDFSALLSSEMFEEFFIDGEITPQCDSIPYPFYHLDGPDCIRHIDSLLKLDKLTGIGQIGVDAEVFHINKPTIIRIPANVYHCPLNFKRVNKPVFFQAACMMPMFGGIYDTPDGPKEMFYNGPVPCKYNANKRCDSCGKCLEEDWRI